jgi:hypothetical protein
MKANSIITLSLLLAILVLGANSYSLLTPGFYAKETANWAAQSIGQDIINIFLIVPALIITACFASRKSTTGLLLWGGVNLYLVYTFAIYSFDLHFNKLFLLYCFCLSLSFYSFIYFLLSVMGKPIEAWTDGQFIIRFIGIYFIVIALVFYFLWLSEILPAIMNDATPKSLLETGLMTNPVHVIDIAIFLPGLFITGIVLLKRKKIGLLLAPVLLTFFILMDITIGGLIFMLKSRGLEGNYMITVIMSLLAVFSAVLLAIYLKSMKVKS